MKSFTALLDKTTKKAIVDDRKIKRVISPLVPSKAMEHIEFCRIEGGRMRITIDSAPWISRLRFMEKQMVSAMRKQQFDVHAISYHVSPELTPIVNKVPRQAIKTSNAAASMEAAADAVADPTHKGGDGDRLRQELLKLARTLRKE